MKFHYFMNKKYIILKIIEGVTMKRITKISVLLVGCLGVSCLYSVMGTDKPFEKTTQVVSALEVKKEISDEGSLPSVNKQAITETVKKWATAFCERDGNALYALFTPDKKEDFFKLKYVDSEISNSYIAFGVSSPWPWETDFEINIEGNLATITYYAMTSDPHVYTWIEKLNLIEKDGQYYVSSEELKECTSVTTKEELMASISGNFNYNKNKLNYINTGLAYTLNKNATENKKIYEKLFSAKTAAPYLLNLSEGKSTVKEKNLTSTVVTYIFKNGESIDIQMTQPFGEKGIWLVEEVDVQGTEHIKSIETWFTKLSIKKLNKIKTVVDTNQMVSTKKGSTILLASIPKEKVYMYGHGGDDGIVIRINNKYQLFPWTYFAPRAVKPKMGYGDYDLDGSKEIAVSFYTGSGTGVSVEELYIVKQQKDGTFYALEYTPYEYTKELSARVKAKYNQTEEKLQLYIDNKKVGKPIDMSSWIKEGYTFSDIEFDNQITFHITNKAITINVLPDCYLEGIPSPVYENMPTISAKVIYKDGNFSLSNIKLIED